MRIMLVSALFAATLAVPAHAQFHLMEMDLQDYVGKYALADGRILTITQHGHKLVAQMDGEAAVKLARTGPATFAAPECNLIVAFDRWPGPDIARVSLTTSVSPARQASR